MFKVYKVDAKMCYDGYALIGAHNAAEANEYINEFKEFDNMNKMDSWGYEFVTEDDVMECINATCAGILDYGIHYMG